MFFIFGNMRMVSDDEGLPETSMKRYFLTFSALFLIMFAVTSTVTVHAQEEVIIEPKPVSDPEVVKEEAQVSSYTADFICSAYYSPLPGQNRYATGTYAGDIRLNGNGVHGASGKRVFPGMVAAPPSFPFGTKMDIAGIGTTEVADRGGAIKGSRLDIWFGAGDDALLRALQYGKRPCSVTVYGLGSTKPISVSIPASNATVSSGNASPYVFKVALRKGDEGEAVKRLQQFLKDLSFFEGEVTGVYEDKTYDSVQRFQNQFGILNTTELSTPGQFGTATLATLDKIVVLAREDEIFIELEKNLGLGDFGKGVESLQEALKRLGYTVLVTGAFDAETKEAVLQFQLDFRVIASESVSGAGYFGPKTFKALNGAINALESGSLDQNTDFVAQSAKTTQQDPLYGLTLGSEGDAVRELQELLFEIRYFGVEPTGYFGPLTQHAVKKLQQRIAVDDALVNGVVTHDVVYYLRNVQANKEEYFVELDEKLRLISFSGKILKDGLSADEVQLLQSFLQKNGYLKTTSVSKYFGVTVKKALVAYQLDKGLIVSDEDVSAGVFEHETQMSVIRDLYDL
jgi:peptidoglycan hydrolase-like protein with peptidoglycan-binding domain/3D (Asp-Asp-Asp) domain-containing protein